MDNKRINARKRMQKKFRSRNSEISGYLVAKKKKEHSWTVSSEIMEKMPMQSVTFIEKNTLRLTFQRLRVLLSIKD